VGRTGGKDFAVLHTNGIHSTEVLFCNCSEKIPRYQQLLRVGLFPATVDEPLTCATFSALRHIHLLNLESGASTHHIYNALHRESDNTGNIEVRVSLDSWPVVATHGARHPIRTYISHCFG
jgi:hypothetical protein